MAEIEVCERQTADRDNMFKDTDDGKVYRRVRDQDAIDVLIDIANGLEITTGETHFNSAATVTTPGTLQTLITETVPASTERQLAQVIFSCRQEGTGLIYSDSVLIGSVRTGAANPFVTFVWSPRYPVATGLEIKVDFKSRTGGPIVDIECHLQAVDKTIP